MIEAEKKGSSWPWILVPIAAVGLFFLLRECRQNIPPAGHATTPEAAAAADPVPSEDAAAPDSTPAPR